METSNEKKKKIIELSMIEKNRLIQLRTAVASSPLNLKELSEICKIGYRHFAFLVRGEKPITDKMKDRIKEGMNIDL